MYKHVETELLKEMKNVRKDLRFLKTRLDEMELSNWKLIAELLPRVRPTKSEKKELSKRIKRSELATERELFKALE